MQGVVFNANYLAYVDDAIDQWFTAVLPGDPAVVEFMVKKAAVEWQSAARYAEVLDLVVHVARWGRTSFDTVTEGSVGDRPVFTATLTYVCVDPETHRPVPVPERVRAALSDGAAG